MGAEQLRSLSHRSLDSEFYTPIPEGYAPGQTKYVVVMGTVMSGLGKGTFASSLGYLLQERGLRVTSLKFDGYLNGDAGTLNPFRHGEVFVLDDGAETDMDLGNYERFLHEDMSTDNYLTGGRVFSRVLARERGGHYLGRDVQIIPHVTGEIKGHLRSLAVNSKADVVLVEVGGTIGDFENGYFVEAMRELAYEEGPGNVCFATITYVLKPSSLGELKTKPAQIGMRQLISLGIQPDLVVVRSPEPISEKAREKLALYSSVPVDRVVPLPDSQTTYAVPLALREAGADDAVLEVLNSKDRVLSPRNGLDRWRSMVSRLSHPEHTLTLGITGKYTSVRDSYHSILNALEHAGAALNARVNVRWIDTQQVEEGWVTVEEALKGLQGIIVPGGFGARGTEGKMACLNHAREHRLPFLGLCYGFQMAVIEYARAVCALDRANSTEINPETPHPVITLLPEQYKVEGLGGNMRLGGRDIELTPGSQVSRLYGGATRVRERFRHRYEVNPQYIAELEGKGLVFSGRAPGQPIMQYLELPGHPYFVATQAHAEFTSRPLKPSPVFVGLVQAMLGQSTLAEAALAPAAEKA
jgi:CTP synthase